MDKDKRWHEIGNRLTGYLGICGCQRKLKSIASELMDIYQKINRYHNEGEPMNFTGAQYLLTAMLERQGLICHGVNCEYPIITNTEFWNWIIEIQNNSALEDN